MLIAQKDSNDNIKEKYLESCMTHLDPHLKCMICQHSAPILVHQLVPGQQVHLV